jgi:hypothetical protein
VYSFGLILYEVLVVSGVIGENEALYDILDKKHSVFMPPMESRLSPWMNNLIQACLQLNPITQSTA